MSSPLSAKMLRGVRSPPLTALPNHPGCAPGSSGPCAHASLSLTAATQNPLPLLTGASYPRVPEGGDWRAKCERKLGYWNVSQIQSFPLTAVGRKCMLINRGAGSFKILMISRIENANSCLELFHLALKRRALKGHVEHSGRRIGLARRREDKQTFAPCYCHISIIKKASPSSSQEAQLTTWARFKSVTLK